MSAPAPAPRKKPHLLLRLLRWGLLIGVALAVLAGAAGAIAYYSVSSRLPEVQSLRDIEMQEPMYVYAQDGRLIALFGETRRYPVEIEDVPELPASAANAFADDNGIAPHETAINRLAAADIVNGIGFDEKFIDRIFTPFQRLHGKDEYPGTGIGLSICRRIVEHHHGRIQASSVPGKSATFIVRLPLRQEDAAQLYTSTGTHHAFR